MPTLDPRIDAYIEKSADFAKPILQRLRALVHKGCPEVTETIKWGMPAFEYRGPFASMASFQKHCTFGFWKAAILFEDPSAADARLTWGAPGRDPVAAKIQSADDLPSDAKILALIRRAKKLNDDGVTLSKEQATKKTPPIPKDFADALKKSKPAAVHFEKFPPSGKREYIEWILEAKRDETRQKRLIQAIEWIAEGKPRNWKYQKK